MSQCGSLYIYPAWSLLRYLEILIQVLYQIWNFLAIISSKFFLPLSFCPLLGFLQCSVCYHIWWCLTGLYVFLHSFFFLLLRPHNCNWTIFRVTGSFFCCSAVLLKTSSKYSISVTILVSTTIAIWLLFVIFISLLIFSLCWDFVLLVSFIPLSIFRTVDSEFFSGTSNIFASLGYFLLISFFSEWPVLPCVFACLVIFLLKCVPFDHYKMATQEIKLFLLLGVWYAYCGL